MKVKIYTEKEFERQLRKLSLLVNWYITITA